MLSENTVCYCRWHRLLRLCCCCGNRTQPHMFSGNGRVKQLILCHSVEHEVLLNLLFSCHTDSSWTLMLCVFQTLANGSLRMLFYLLRLTVQLCESRLQLQSADSGTHLLCLPAQFFLAPTWWRVRTQTVRPKLWHGASISHGENIPVCHCAAVKWLYRVGIQCVFGSFQGWVG